MAHETRAGAAVTGRVVGALPSTSPCCPTSPPSDVAAILGARPPLARAWAEGWEMTVRQSTAAALARGDTTARDG